MNRQGGLLWAPRRAHGCPQPVQLRSTIHDGACGALTRRNSVRTVIVNQARMSSTRLPGKVLKEVLGRPLLDYQVERLRRSTLAHELVIATTTNSADDVLAEFCRKREVPVFRGSEQDVLARYYFAALEHRAEVVVRVTADCPVIDPEVVDRVIGRFLERAAAVDYVSNTQLRTYPRGMDT